MGEDGAVGRWCQHPGSQLGSEEAGLGADWAVVDWAGAGSGAALGAERGVAGWAAAGLGAGLGVERGAAGWAAAGLGAGLGVERVVVDWAAAVMGVALGAGKAAAGWAAGGWGAGWAAGGWGAGWEGAWEGGWGAAVKVEGGKERGPAVAGAAAMAVAAAVGLGGGGGAGVQVAWPPVPPTPQGFCQDSGTVQPEGPNTADKKQPRTSSSLSAFCWFVCTWRYLAVGTGHTGGSRCASIGEVLVLWASGDLEISPREDLWPLERDQAPARFFSEPSNDSYDFRAAEPLTYGVPVAVANPSAAKAESYGVITSSADRCVNVSDALAQRHNMHDSRRARDSWSQPQMPTMESICRWRKPHEYCNSSQIAAPPSGC